MLTNSNNNLGNLKKLWCSKPNIKSAGAKSYTKFNFDCDADVNKKTKIPLNLKDRRNQEVSFKK